MKIFNIEKHLSLENIRHYTGLKVARDFDRNGFIPAIPFNGIKIRPNI